MSRPWMPLYISDYRRDTAHLSAAEHGAYLLLIMRYWEAGGLPTDEKQLARIACMTTSEWKRSRETLAAFFGPGWIHKRINVEIARADEISSKRSASAKQRYSKSAANADAIAPANADTVHSTQKEGGGGDAGARGQSLISPDDFAFADRVLDAWGVDREDPRAIATAYTARRWLNAGWNAELCVATIQTVMAALAASGRNGPDSLKYFEKAIARAHAEQAAPVPVAEIPKAKYVKASTHETPGNGSFASALAKLGSTAASLRASADSGGGEDAPRLLSDGGGERS